eukprot:SAG11_NODE_3704_length_2269_cov_1.513825_3_plen_108_part_00
MKQEPLQESKMDTDGIALRGCTQSLSLAGKCAIKMEMGAVTPCLPEGLQTLRDNERVLLLAHAMASLSAYCCWRTGEPLNAAGVERLSAAVPDRTGAHGTGRERGKQ